MQLGQRSPLRLKLSAAACLLLASGASSAAVADSATTTQVDATALLYGEQNRANVVEPTARITRIFPNGQELSAQLAIDAITGASPSGAVPSGRIQTTTSASGRVRTIPAGQIPTTRFKDTRVALDGGWKRRLGWFTPTLGGHLSREKDYQSLGVNSTLAIDLMRRLTTLTVGAGIDHDRVFPVGGIMPGLADSGAVAVAASNPKRVVSGMVGLSQILSRRWILALTASRMVERGDLTEPYKVVSVLDPGSGLPATQLTEQRPGTRTRTDVLASSAYHLERDVLYLSYRYYWDDWNVRSHAVDAKYRHELANQTYLEPHLRVYGQTAARFFHSALIRGDPLPDFASSDYRLGRLTTVTLGATYGFHIPNAPGEWSVRGEYIGQFGVRHPPDVVGVQRQYDLFPPLSIGSLVVGYSVQF